MSFWGHACAVYGKSGVEAVLLKLQDHYGLVINHLLMAVYLANKGQTMSWRPLLTQERDSQVLAKLVAPVRNFRRDAKSGVSESTYQALKSVELSLERVHIAWLEQQSSMGLAALEGASLSENLAQVLADYLKAATSLGVVSIDVDDSDFSLAMNEFISTVTS